MFAAIVHYLGHIFFTIYRHAYIEDGRYYGICNGIRKAVTLDDTGIVLKKTSRNFYPIAPGGYILPSFYIILTCLEHFQNPPT